MSQEQIDSLFKKDYAAGFVTNIESDTLPPGLDEDVIAFISAKKGEPEWMLEWRLKAYRAWCEMEEPEWAHVSYPKINFQDISYFLRLKVWPISLRAWMRWIRSYWKPIKN